MKRANSDPAQESLPKRSARLWLLGGGWLLFGIGFIGIFLPVLPTTVFWIGAVWCWSRSAPELTKRILSHPRFGHHVHLFIEHGQMTRQGKWTALGGIAAGFALLLLLGRPAWPLALAVGLTLVLVGLWLWQRPEPEQSTLPSSKLHFSSPPRTIDSVQPRQGRD